MSVLRNSSSQLVSRLGTRSVHVSSIARAAVAPATSTSSSTTSSGRPTSSSLPIKKAAVARRSPTIGNKSTPPSLLASASPTKATQAADDPYDFSDFPAPSTEILDDYASLSRGSTSSGGKNTTPPDLNGPMPSPPLSEMPSSDYSPLPSSTLKFSSSSPPGSSTGSGSGGTLAGGSHSIAGEVSAPSVFHGMSEKPFEKDTIEALLKPIHPDDVEVKPDGLLYLPEIKYRRTLNAAFGPGGWGMAPRGETNVGDRIVSREWGLVCLGRLVSIARGEQEYFDKSGIPTATEACKSNALMRCCKDLGIASELWDPRYIRDFKEKHCVEVFVEHATKKSKRKLWRKKKGPKFEYPWKET